MLGPQSDDSLCSRMMRHCTITDTDAKQLTRHRPQVPYDRANRHVSDRHDATIDDGCACDYDESWSGDTLRRRSTGLVRRATVTTSRSSGCRSTAQHRRRHRRRARANDCSSARRRLARATSTRCNVPITACTRRSKVARLCVVFNRIARRPQRGDDRVVTAVLWSPRSVSCSCAHSTSCERQERRQDSRALSRARGSSSWRNLSPTRSPNPNGGIPVDPDPRRCVRCFIINKLLIE